MRLVQVATLALIAILFLLLLGAPPTARAMPALAIADSFRFPLNGSANIVRGYAAHPNWGGAPSCYYPTPWTSLYHTAEDWATTPNTTVYAVANGTVQWYDPGYDYDQGRVVIIRHTLPDGSTIYSMYGHLADVYVSVGQTVSKGDAIATVYDQSSTNNTHLHWEMRYFADGSGLCSNPNARPGVPGPGYTDVHPDSRGYTSPSAFVANHQGGGTPVASWASPSNNQTIAARTVHLQANVSGGTGGINRVAFSAKWSGTWRGVATITSSPYQYDWDWCNSGVPDGDVELGLEVWDNAGNHYVYSEHYPNYHITKSYNCSQPPPPSGNWHVEYFGNKNLGGRCYEGWENSIFILKNFGGGSPASGCPTDNFSARFTSNVNFGGGEYRFHCQHDDGCRIYIDGQLRLDAWWDSSFTGHDWAGTLSGTREVRIELYDSGGDARIEAWWQGNGFLPRDENRDPNQWYGEYFANRNLEGMPLLKRNEGTGTLDRNWGGGGVGYGIPNDNFSARWTRTVNFAAGQYRFHVRHDDGARFYVDDTLKLDVWGSCCQERTVDVWLTSGNHTLRLEWYDSGGDASAAVWWDTLTLCYDLATTVSPTNAGTINRSVNPNCNGNQYTQGTNVALTANANSGYTFDTWSGCDSVNGNTCNVTINSNRSVTANFRPSVTCYTLNTIANPTNSGSLSVLTSQNCTGGFLPGTSVQVRANPAFGYVLDSWTGCDTTAGNTCTIAMNSPRTVTANFAYAVRITAISPRAPYCVLRNAATVFERTLFITGQNFENWYHLQFLKVATGETSIHFNMEVNWTSATNVSVDIARIKHLLWTDSKVALQVRITGYANASYQPLSDWSAQFTLADNATVCGATQPVHSLFLPFVRR